MLQKEKPPKNSTFVDTVDAVTDNFHVFGQMSKNICLNVIEI